MSNKTRTLVILFLAASFFVFGSALARNESKPEPKLVQFYMGILKKAPKWAATKTSDTEKLHQQHMVYVVSLLESGKVIVAGPLTDESDLRGVYIFRAQTAEEARGWAENDPAVKDGHLVVEMHPWWSEDIFKKANSPLKLSTVYLGFLRKGPNRKEGDGNNPEIQELQKAHLANINRLAEMKKLIAAGPFGDDGDLRGIFVFRVATLQEAQTLAATDPMVKTGRLVIDLHPWMVPDGVLP